MSEDELQSSCLIATYPFTSPIVDVRITPNVVHALTDHGIETYTHRIGHKLFSCSYEYNLRDDLFTVEVRIPFAFLSLRWVYLFNNLFIDAAVSRHVRAQKSQFA